MIAQSTRMTLITAILIIIIAFLFSHTADFLKVDDKSRENDLEAKKKNRGNLQPSPYELCATPWQHPPVVTPIKLY